MSSLGRDRKNPWNSAVTFGIRKQIQAEYGVPELEKKKTELEKKKLKLENRETELRNRIDAIDKKNAEKRGIDEKRRKDEDEYLGKLEEFLHGMLYGKQRDDS